MSIPSSPERSTDALRASVRQIRRSLDAAALDAAATSLARQLCHLEVLAGPGTLGTYLPTDGEIDPNLAMDELRARGWQTALPVIGDDRAMSYAPWSSTTTLAPNRFGIDEPAPPVTSLSTDQLDVVLVPCVAVDLDGNRIGFGAGFYDRAFAPPAVTADRTAADTLSPDAPAPDATTPPRRAVLVGVVHDIQVVERVEPDPWDVPMDLIVTEARVIRPGR